MKKMQDTASPGHFVCRRMLILKTFLVILLWSTCLVSGYRGHAQEKPTVTGKMTVRCGKKYTMCLTCSGENDGYGEHDGCHAE